MSHRSIEKALQDIEQLTLSFGRRSRVSRFRIYEVADLTALEGVLALGISGTTGRVMLRYLRAKMSHQAATVEVVAKGAINHLEGKGEGEDRG